LKTNANSVMPTPRTRLLARAGAISILLVAGTLAGCQRAPEADRRTETLVRVQTVAFEDYAPSLTLTGSVRARTETPLSFQVSGQVKELLAEVGDRVEAGQVLARLSPEEQLADVDAAQAALDAAEAQVRQTQATFDRQNSLFQQGLVTRSAFETAQTALRTAQSSRDSARAQLETAQEALSYTELHASAAGVITQRELEVDEVAQAGAPVYVLAEDGPRDAVFNVQESAFPGQSMDVPVRLALVSDPDVAVEGHVREVSPTIDPQTGTVEVKVEIENPTDALALGAAITGTASGVPTQQVVLPWSALWLQDGAPAVWTVGADRSVAITPVSVSAYGTGTVVIDGGLEAGQMVVTQGTKLLTPGQIVAFEEGA